LEEHRRELLDSIISRNLFKPELLNRFDEVIIFEPLKLKDMAEIVKLQLKGLLKLLEDQEMGFAFTDAAIKEIAHEGYDPIFGARPLRRAIQKLIENPISSLIIEGKLKAGNTVQADFDGSAFVFNIEQVTMVPAGSTIAQREEFKCNACQTVFETEVNEHATVICKNCGSSKVAKQAKPLVDSVGSAERKEDLPPIAPPAAAAIPDNKDSAAATQPS
jgi:Zn finger protein HypA/HybF involved in hydrogenase expression